MIKVNNSTEGRPRDLNRRTESCRFDDDLIKCTTVDPVLSNYAAYPEIMRVPDDFCLK